MGIALASNFDVNAALPLDSRMVVADLTARDAIVAGRRFQGMCVYVIADTLTYQLKTGVLNTDWVEYGGGIAAATFVEKFSGDGGNLVFTLANDPLAIENTMVFVDGVYQQKTTSYILNMTDVEFVEAPPIGVDNIEVMYTTPTGTLVIPDGYITTVHLADDAVTTDKILDANVTTAKIADGAITAAKLAAGVGGNAITQGTQTALFQITTSTFTLITASAFTIAKEARAIRFFIIPRTDGTFSSQYFQANAGSGPVQFQLIRGASTIVAMQSFEPSAGAWQLPLSCLEFYETSLTTGSLNYELRASISGGRTLTMTNYIVCWQYV